MWTHIRFPSQTMILLSKDITDFTKEGKQVVFNTLSFYRSLHIQSRQVYDQTTNQGISRQDIQCTSHSSQYVQYAWYCIPFTLIRV